jgi:hypothetical protein
MKLGDKMETKHYCPILSVSRDYFEKCQEGKCKFWCFMYSTEGIQVYDCCFVLNALKNSEGEIPV